MRRPSLSLAGFLLLALWHTGTAASEPATLKEAFEAMRLRLEALEAEKREADSAGNRGVLELGSADTVLSVGGRVQLDLVYGWPEGSYFAKKVPLSASGEEGQLGMSARDSRLWVKVRRPSSLGVVRALIETDFWGASGTETNTNAHGPRLRHAYVDIGGLAIGQTNSLFNAFVTLDTVTYAINDTFVRQPLIRYSTSETGWGWDVSLEQPETTLMESDGTMITPQDDRFPDIGGRLRYYPQWGEAAVAGIARYIAQDHAGDRNSSTHAWGWGLNTSAKIKVGAADDIRCDLQYGSGIGRYLAYNVFPAGSIDGAGNITLRQSWGGHLGYRHWWRRDLRSTVGYSYVATEKDDGADADVTRSVSGLQANLIWTPLPNALVALEYAGARRELESGAAGELDLLRLTFRYSF
jgi:hypothetical protein